VFPRTTETSISHLDNDNLNIRFSYR